MAQLELKDRRGNMRSHSMNPFDSDDELPTPAKKELFPSSKSFNPFADDDDLPHENDASVEAGLIRYEQATVGVQSNNPFDDDEENLLESARGHPPRKRVADTEYTNPFEDDEEKNDVVTVTKGRIYNVTSVLGKLQNSATGPSQAAGSRGTSMSEAVQGRTILDVPKQSRGVGLLLHKDVNNQKLPSFRSSKTMEVKDKADRLPSMNRSSSSHIFYHGSSASSSQLKGDTSSSARFPPVFKCKSTFGSQDFRELFGHKDEDAEKPPVFKSTSTFGSEDYRELFGYKDKDAVQPPVFTSTSAFGSENYRELFGHKDKDAVQLPVFKSMSTFGSEDYRELFGHKDKDAEQNHHYQGTKSKELFGYEGANTESTQKADNLFGFKNPEDYKSSEKAKDLFGIEDMKFETGKKGHDLFGNDVVTSASGNRTKEVYGYEDAESENNQKARQVSGKEEEGDEEDYMPSAPAAEEYANKAVQDLEDYALTKSEDTTATIVNCIRVAEDSRGVAGTTLETLHYQGVQIERTHEKAVQLEQHLQVGEKLLNSLGGIFSKKWKPKKTRKITGPMIGSGGSVTRRGTQADRTALGLTDGQNYADKARKPFSVSMPRETASFESRLEMDRKAQDDGLSELSHVIGQLKEMSYDMNNEVERQSEGIDHLHDDVVEIHSRVQQSNVRGAKLLRR